MKWLFRMESVLSVTLIVTGLGCNNRASNTASAPVAIRPPAQVETAKVSQESIKDYREYTGRLSAINSVDIRARVSGYLLQSPESKVASAGENVFDASHTESKTSQVIVEAKEGDFVQKGNVLFQIDPEPYVRILEQAAGSLAAKRAQAKRLESELLRTRELIRSNSISKADLDSAIANSDEANGQIANLEASVAQAKLNVDFTKITSPINGVVGQTLVTRGNLVMADATVLTTVVSTDPIYAYFDVDENSVLDYRKRVRAGNVPSARDSSIPVQLGLANEQGYPHRGLIDFVDNKTDSSTGNTRMRAVFENKSGALSPGLFARVQAPFSEDYVALLVPTKAMAMDQAGKFVMVVNPDSSVRRQSVHVGSIRGSNIVIREGLGAEDVVVVSGSQKIKPGDKVTQKQPTEARILSDSKSDPQSAPSSRN